MSATRPACCHSGADFAVSKNAVRSDFYCLARNRNAAGRLSTTAQTLSRSYFTLLIAIRAFCARILWCRVQTIYNLGIPANFCISLRF